jgi:hypothetical protein
MNELRIWMDSKEAVFMVGFLLGACFLALLSSVFKALKPDGVRALKQQEPTDAEYVKGRFANTGEYFTIMDRHGEWCVNVFADSINLEGNSGPFHFVKDGAIVAGANSSCSVSIQGKRQSRYFTVEDLIQSADAVKSQPAVEFPEERQTKTKEGIRP